VSSAETRTSGLAHILSAGREAGSPAWVAAAKRRGDRSTEGLSGSL